MFFDSIPVSGIESRIISRKGLNDRYLREEEFGIVREETQELDKRNKFNLFLPSNSTILHFLRKSNLCLPISYCAFKISDNSLNLFEWQGVKKKKSVFNRHKDFEIMSRINWRGLFVDLLNLEGKLLNLDNISISGVRNNYWVKDMHKYFSLFCEDVSFEDFLDLSDENFFKEYQKLDDIEKDLFYLSLTPQRAYKIYDQTALNLGFQPDGKGDYVLDLK
jgi:hypothetical protein